MKKTITESQLRNIIAESVKKCLAELNEYHPEPNTNMYAWRGRKTGEGAIDKDGYPIQKPVQSPKPIGNQKAAPMDDRMKKMNEGLFGPSKKQIAAKQAARQAERDRKQTEWDEWQKANSDRIESQYQSEYNKRKQQRDYADRVQKQKDAEELETYKNGLRNQPQRTFVVYKRGGGVAGETTNQQEAEQWAKQVGGTYAMQGNAPWNNC